MNVTLTRTDFRKDGIFGQLSIEGEPFCVTLEHAYEQPDGTFAPKIPSGTYHCVRGTHQLHSGPVVTYEVLGVDGHSGLLCCHVGNFNADSEGCVLCGAEISESAGPVEWFITNSKGTFALWNKRMEGVTEYELTVV